ncbi:macro domain-containing protein [Neobacillus sp. YIM B02564]|uniref:Macro domain-containing protein n=1 Tax=Neobacillus paridis TaxID=2803862 RepID=A0ABS1TMQ1_9BACI|nr:macro domain-containing protein [Neobacillus paridis]MBL4952019.1 macro domain-containing protein [Neobacillus paridis]
MKYQEIERDLFTVPNYYALAHCISADCKLGAGIALQFNKKFPVMKQDLLSRNPKVGEAQAFHGPFLIFNLITKEKYWQKPTYKSLTQSLYSMKHQLTQLGFHHLAMPRIGCGLDKLDWPIVRSIIKEVFQDTSIEILICVK